MVRWVSNLPDEEHTPFPRLAEQPHIKDIVSYFRPSDYTLIFATGFGIPGLYALWERYQPTHHPKYLPRILAVQVPGMLVIGAYAACVKSVYRFWGLSENAKEHARWKSEGKDQKTTPKQGWQDADW